jgi:hypothetical protein
VNKLLCCVLLMGGAAIAQTAMAQTPPAQPPANDADAMEPGVNTSAPEAAPQAPAAGTPRATTPATTQPAGTTTSRPAANKPAATTPRRGNAQDRLDLESTQITGNRELPKVLYIVPWRNAELGDLVGRPVNSLLDEVLEPVDRDVFRRQNRYYEALQPDEAAPAGKPEK